MSRTTQIHCNRCGATILGGHSILRVEAGDLANRLEGEPFVDLCEDCCARFLDWLRSGRQNGENDAGAIGATPAVESTPKR